MKSTIPLSLFLLILLCATNARAEVPNPFLSTTLSTKITYLSSADASVFDSDRKAIFSEALTHFLHKIFSDQQVHDVKVISVNVFDDHLPHDGHYEEAHRHDSRENEGARHTSSFSTVVAAEYTKEAVIDSIANDSFRGMLVHVCEKFQAQLIEFLHATGDPYFMEAESVVLGDFERVRGMAKGGENTMSSAEATNNHNGVWNTASIIAIVLGSIAFVSLTFGSVKLYRIEKQLRERRWSSKEIATISSSNFPGALQHTTDPMDNYLFTSPGVDKGHGGITSAYTDFKDDPIIKNRRIDEGDTSFSSVWPESGPPNDPPQSTLFPDRRAAATTKAETSYTEELNQLPKQHVFAPPGKIGVAIDVVNGQPVVHKVRRSSPLESMLRPNDVIMALDDEDVSCLSAADVTSMMVKRMDRVRKITFVRRS